MIDLIRCYHVISFCVYNTIVEIDSDVYDPDATRDKFHFKSEVRNILKTNMNIKGALNVFGQEPSYIPRTIIGRKLTVLKM